MPSMKSKQTIIAEQQNELDDLKERNQNLNRELTDRNLELIKAREELEIATSRIKAIDKSTSECSFAIDFEKLNVFSVERIVRENIPITIIGYLGVDGNVKSWYYYCSEEIHNNLAKQFIKCVEEKKNGNNKNII